MKKVLVIAGPTAVGKSDLAVRIAQKYDLEIISGDSIQVYRGLDIGSGKVTKEEMQDVKHHLIDILSTSESYSVSLFQKMARQIIDQSEKPMIICGGTGLYLKACLYDYSFEEEKEEAYDSELDIYTNEQLYEMLKQTDPLQAEKIHVNNRRRLLRSLTIQRNTGKTQSEIEQMQKHEMIYDALIIGCTMEREQLYQRINQRVEKMFQNGLQEEIELLLKQGVSFENTCMQGIGYKEWKEYFDGNQSIEEVKAAIQLHSRRFAKRQYTWLNHQMPVDWYTMNDSNETERMMEKIDTFLRG